MKKTTPHRRFIATVGLLMLAAASARADYQSTVLNDHPLAYYPINSDTDPTGGVATDVSGNGYNGAYVAQSPQYNPAPGPSPFLPNALNFDGGTSYVDLSGANNAALNFGGTITMEAWVQPSVAFTHSGNFGDILGKGYDGTYEMTLRAQGSGYYGGLYDGGNHGASGDVQTTNWTYVVSTYDGTNWNMYINGQLTQAAASSVGAANFSAPWAIGTGTAQGAGRFFQGNMCQVALYTNALSASQVLAHYFIGQYGTTPSNSVPIITGQPASQVSHAGGQATFNVSVFSVLPTTNQWYKGNTPLIGQTNTTLVLNNVQAGDAVNYSVVIGNSNGTTNSAIVSLTLSPLGVYDSTVLKDSPLAYYPINSDIDPTGATATDISGNGYNGTYVGQSPQNNSVAGPSPFLANALSFDGSASFVDLSGANNAALNFGGTITMEAWVQPATPLVGANNNFADILGKGYGSGYEMTMRAQGGNYYSGIYVGSNNSNHGASGGVQTTNWTYIVSTYDGTNWNIYMNGQLAQANADPAGPANFSAPWAIGTGTASGNNRWFQGNICHVALYTNALSASQIFTHYFAGQYGVTPSNSVPIISGQPTPQVSYVGGGATFNVSVFSVLPTTNQWYKGNTPLIGQTNATLVLKNVQAGDAVNYSVVIGNSNGTTNSAAASLTLSLPTPGLYASTVLNDSPLLYCPLDPSVDTTSTAYDWSGNGNNGVYANASAGFNSGAGPSAYITNAASFSGSTYADLSLGANASILNFGGQITMEAWVQPGDVSQNLQDILAKGYDSYQNYAEIVLRQDYGTFTANGQSGGTAQVGVWSYVVSTYDGTNYNLYVNGTLVAQSQSAAGVANFVDPWRIGNGSVSGAGRLFTGSLSQIALYNHSLSAAQVWSHYLIGKFGTTNVFPAVITQQPANASANAGSTATFTAVGSGSPVLAYQWYDVTAGAPGTAIADATNSTLTLDNVSTAQNGNWYAVVVTNLYGQATSSSAQLTVFSGPLIIQTDLSPLNTRAFVGTPIKYSVTVNGTSPFHFQWLQDGSPVGMNSSTYTATVIAGTHTYSCTVTNSQGSVSSSTATIVGVSIMNNGGNSGTNASTFCINFVNAGTAYYDGANWLNIVYQGLGAYADSPANTNWNGFSLPNNGYNYPNGTPYPDNYNSAKWASDGTLTPITLSLIYGGDSCGLDYEVTYPGQSLSWAESQTALLLGSSAYVNASKPGIGTSASPLGSITISNVPSGTYNLYVYAINTDNTRGGTFTFNSGGALNGINTTTNAGDVNSTTNFVFGANYIIFTNVVPDANHNITGTWGAVTNPKTGLSGEGDFNGLQLVRVSDISVAVPPILTIQLIGNTPVINWTGTQGILQSATSVSGPYTDISGATSPYTNSASGSSQFFRLRITQ